MEGINFLAHLYDTGFSYSAICIARSALSSYLEIKDCDHFGNHPLVRRFMKGTFEMRPALPKYANTWNVDVVFKYLESLYPYDEMSLKCMSQKLAMLLSLLSGQRVQTLHKLSIDSMKMDDTKCVFDIQMLLKQTRRGKHLAPIELLAYQDNSSLCIVQLMKIYLKRTANIRKDAKQLFISYQKPYGPVSKDTLSRWIKEMLIKAGIDTTHFGAHSVRSASTSAAARKGLSVDTIMKAAGWSAESTFTKFYNKKSSSNFGQTLLDGFCKNI